MCKKHKILRSTLIAIIFGGVFILLGCSWWLLIKCFPSYEVRGTFGDMFGVVNALFSGLAFAGLIVTLLYQKEELALQRVELKETREEMKNQRMEFEEQNKTLKRQRFENTFFNMLSLQQEIVANLSYKEHKGREIFEELYLSSFILYDETILHGIRAVLNRFGYSVFSSIPLTTCLDHYFRHLYRIFKYVDTSSLIAENERYEYAAIIRAQLANYELIIMFYNCLSLNGCEKFKPLIEKYSTFNNLRKDLLVNQDDISLYAASAYNRDSE